MIHGEREFSVLVTPEHLPPINPSPWYAFRYEAGKGADVTVHVHYLAAKHRYRPILSDGSVTSQLEVETSNEGKSAKLVLPPGRAIVSAQEIVDAAHYRKALRHWAAGRDAQRFVIGRSHDRRDIVGVRIGRVDAPRLVVLLGRQHPPEVTGAIAMEAFVDRVAEMVEADAQLGQRYQFAVIPLVNPDGVARGNWRANLGGKDLNRDWGHFTQPETQAVKRWLDALPAGVKVAAMLDFHSTNRNLFYVQGNEASEREERFLNAWLSGRENALPDYPFTIERRDANPGGGTTKNWFHSNFGVPAYTYEVGDNSDRASIRSAARALASALPEALEELER
ncbi:MAG: M14 family metallopeptidase [Erythrobacter sp.]